MTLEETLRKIVREEVDRVVELLQKPTVQAAVLDAEEAAKMLKMPVDSVRKRAARGEIPSFKMGTHVRFRVAELQAWVEGRGR